MFEASGDRSAPNHYLVASILQQPPSSRSFGARLALNPPALNSPAIAQRLFLRSRCYSGSRPPAIPNAQSSALVTSSGELHPPPSCARSTDSTSPGLDALYVIGGNPSLETSKQIYTTDIIVLRLNYKIWVWKVKNCRLVKRRYFRIFFQKNLSFCPRKFFIFGAF